MHEDDDDGDEPSPAPVARRHGSPGAGRSGYARVSSLGGAWVRAGIDSPDGPAGAGARWGRSLPAAWAPFSPLSSQSGHGVPPESGHGDPLDLRTAAPRPASRGSRPPPRSHPPAARSARPSTPGRPTRRARSRPTPRHRRGPRIRPAGGAAAPRWHRPAPWPTPSTASVDGRSSELPARVAPASAASSRSGSAAVARESISSVSSASRSGDQVVPLARSLSSSSFCVSWRARLTRRERAGHASAR